MRMRTHACRDVCSDTILYCEKHLADNQTGMPLDSSGQHVKSAVGVKEKLECCTLSCLGVDWASLGVALSVVTVVDLI